MVKTPRIRFTGSLVGCMLLMLPTGGFCANSPTIGMESYFRMIWGLLVVLGVILLLYGLLKKRFSILTNSDGKNIRVLEMKPLGSRKMLCLVEVKGEEFLLGVSGDSITHLATLGAQPTSKTSPKDFQSVLQQAGSEAKR